LQFSRFPVDYGAASQHLGNGQEILKMKQTFNQPSDLNPEIRGARLRLLLYLFFVLVPLTAALLLGFWADALLVLVLCLTALAIGNLLFDIWRQVFNWLTVANWAVTLTGWLVVSHTVSAAQVAAALVTALAVTIYWRLARRLAFIRRAQTLWLEAIRLVGDSPYTISGHALLNKRIPILCVTLQPYTTPGLNLANSVNPVTLKVPIWSTRNYQRVLELKDQTPIPVFNLELYVPRNLLGRRQLCLADFVWIRLLTHSTPEQ
jgi:hypothetical protein